MLVGSGKISNQPLGASRELMMQWSYKFDEMKFLLEKLYFVCYKFE